MFLIVYFCEIFRFGILFIILGEAFKFSNTINGIHYGHFDLDYRRTGCRGYR